MFPASCLAGSHASQDDPSNACSGDGSQQRWWQARREKVGPRDYGVTAACVAALTYGKSALDRQLLGAYQTLKAALAAK